MKKSEHEIIFNVSVGSCDPLAVVVLSSDDIGQGAKPH